MGRPHLLCFISLRENSHRLDLLAPVRHLQNNRLRLLIKHFVCIFLSSMEGKGNSAASTDAPKWGANQMGAPAQPPSYPDNQQANTYWNPHSGEGKGASSAQPEPAKWGTHQMGTPAPPPSHPENQKAAAYWGPHRGDEERPPYILFESGNHSRPASGTSPMETILDAFNSWTRKAETLASNVWQNLRTAPSMMDAAWGKVSLTAKALTEGGFETLYRQSFPADPSDRVKKSFACYLSTTTGPVAGTLYLTTANVAFCSDRPLSFKAPSGQEAWSFYKVFIPLQKIANVDPVTVRENPPEKYIKVVTVDGHEFWFMGFVSYEKASNHLLNAVHDMAAGQWAAGHGTAGHGTAGHGTAEPYVAGPGGGASAKEV